VHKILIAQVPIRAKTRDGSGKKQLTVGVIAAWLSTAFSRLDVIVPLMMIALQRQSFVPNGSMTPEKAGIIGPLGELGIR